MFHVSFWHWLLASSCGQKIATLNAIYFGSFGYPVATSWLKFEQPATPIIQRGQTHATCCNYGAVSCIEMLQLFGQGFTSFVWASVRPIWTLNSSRKCEIQTKVHWPWYDSHHCSLELPTDPLSKTGTMGAESVCSARTLIWPQLMLNS